MKGRSQALKRRRTPSNLNGVVRIALTVLKRGGWTVLPTDKDGGFFLISKVALLSELHSIVAGPSYRKIVETHDVELDVFEHFVARCQSACKILGDSGLFKAMVSSGRQGLGPMVAHSIATIKTHKAPGEVELRGIHACPESPMYGALRWIVAVLRPIIDRISFSKTRATFSNRSIPCRSVVIVCSLNSTSNTFTCLVTTLPW